MVQKKMYLSLLIMFFSISNTNCKHKQSITRFDRFDVCYCPENCVMKDFQFNFRHPERENTLMNFKFSLTQDISKVRVIVIPERCKNREVLDSCESTSAFNSDNGCSILGLRNVMWSGFTESFTPTFKCPFKKGPYVSINSTFDADLYRILPLQGWAYKSRLELYNGTGHVKNLLWAFCLEFSVVNVL